MFTNPIDITARRKTDELLGESYKVVKEVRDNLATIKAVYLEKDKITSYAESLQALVQALQDKRDGLFIGHDMGTVGEEDLEVTFTGDNPISAITRNLEAIDAVKDSIDAINSINNHLRDIKATALCLEDILDCNENKNAVLAVASVIENVKKLGEVSDNLVSLIRNMDTVINVSNNLNSLQAISEGISAVEQVNAAFSVINNLNDSLVAIKAVSAKTESIDVVATVADKLNLICEALTDIETVAQMKETLTKISQLDGFENMADVSALSNQVTKNTNDIATLTNTTIPALREQIGSGSIPENLSATISEHTTKISKLETDVASLQENGTSSGTGTEVDLSAYALKTELTKTNGNVSRNTNALTGLTQRIVALEGNSGSGSGTSVDLSDYAKKSDVDTLKGNVIITAGKTDLAGLDSRITTLESSASSGSSSSESGSGGSSGNSDIGGWFPFHDPRGYGRSSGIRHEYDTPESIEWEAPADCWVVIEGKGGGTASKDSSIYATISYGVDQHFCGNGTQSGGNIYVYGSTFMCKGSKLKITISNMNWIYLAHTAIYKDEGARPASDTPAATD